MTKKNKTVTHVDMLIGFNWFTTHPLIQGNHSKKKYLKKTFIKQ